MTVSKVLVCPVCGKRTLVRVQDGAYLSTYPIRINCMNCKTLMKGTYNMTGDGPKGFQMINSRIEKPQVEASKDNSSANFLNVEYVAEISGELPCFGPKEYVGGYPNPPFLRAVEAIKIGDSSMIKYIERLKQFPICMSKWKRYQAIAFQLLDDGSYEYIGKALHDHLGKYPYNCDNIIKKFECIETSILENTQYLFNDGEQEELIKTIIKQMSKIDRNDVLNFIHIIGGKDQLLDDYRRIVEVFSEFMDIYEFLLPAEFYMNYADKSLTGDYLSTCSFTDIKSFYQDAYEACLSSMYLPVCLDNKIERNEFLQFSESYTKTDPWTNKKVKFNDDLARYKYLDNGMKLKLLQRSETFQDLVNIQANSYLRNGIGHNNYIFDAITQEIVTFDKKKPGKTTSKKKLMSVAVDCIGLVKSAVAISEIIMYLLRTIYRQENVISIMDPRFYRNTSRKDKCPCGSGNLYKNCCEKEVNNTLKMYLFTHPNG